MNRLKYIRYNGMVLVPSPRIYITGLRISVIVVAVTRERTTIIICGGLSLLPCDNNNNNNNNHLVVNVLARCSSSISSKRADP